MGPSPRSRTGQLNVELDRSRPALYLQPLPYRVRALVEGETVFDALQPLLLHETGRLPVYLFRPGDVRRDLLEPAEREEDDGPKGARQLWDLRIARALFETGLPSRYYVPPEDVRTELLVPSSSRSRCAYKGSASYWHVRIGDRLFDDVVWSYPEPQLDAEPVRDLLCFFNERVDLQLEGEEQERPATQWTRDDSERGGQPLRGLMRPRR